MIGTLSDFHCAGGEDRRAVTTHVEQKNARIVRVVMSRWRVMAVSVHAEPHIGRSTRFWNRCYGPHNLRHECFYDAAPHTHTFSLTPFSFFSFSVSLHNRGLSSLRRLVMTRWVARRRSASLCRMQWTRRMRGWVGE